MNSHVTMVALIQMPIIKLDDCQQDFKVRQMRQVSRIQ
jgi:hypothetical protein